MNEGINPQEADVRPKDDAVEKAHALRGLLGGGMPLVEAIKTLGLSVEDPETALDIMATVNIRASFNPSPSTNEDMKEAASLVPRELMTDSRFTQAVTLAASPAEGANQYNYFRTERKAQEGK